MSRQRAHRARRHIARNADLERDIRGRAGGAPAPDPPPTRMPCPMRSAPSRSAPHTDSGPAGLARVRRQPQSVIARELDRLRVNHSAGPRSSSPPIPNETTPSSHALRRQLGHLHRMLRAEMADGIQIPLHFNRRSHRLPLHGIVNRRKVLLLPKNHARRQRDLRITHILPLQATPEGAA